MQHILMQMPNLQSFLFRLTETLCFLPLVHTEKMLWHILTEVSEKACRMHNFVWPQNISIPCSVQGWLLNNMARQSELSQRKISAYAQATYTACYFILRNKNLNLSRGVQNIP
uniref:Putative secreted protein n=1 Tax=Amblyomma americanum TaxID=6943 RepID=A0A0C9R4C7_AMBAM